MQRPCGRQSLRCLLPRSRWPRFVAVRPSNSGRWPLHTGAWAETRTSAGRQWLRHSAGVLGDRRLAAPDHPSLEYPQYTTSISQPSLESVTIPHPHHPLWGQRCEVVFIRRGVDPDLIRRLADGTHAAMAMSWPDAGEGQALSAAQSGSDLPLLDLQGLRQILHLVGQLRQEDRFPTPRRSTPPLASCAA
jgi:Family of unknown function (DUF5372)